MFRFVLILFAVTATPSFAFPSYAYERAEVFAVCSGRLSALHVRQKADRNPAAWDTRKLKSEFDALFDAVIDSAYAEGVPGTEPTRWRARGWTEVASLLNHAQYSADQELSEAARRALARRVQDCRDLVLVAA